MKTGTICTQGGTYCCALHRHYRITLSKGERFPPCNAGRHGTTWLLLALS